MYRIVATAILTFIVLGARAQQQEYMLELGAGAGISWAYGDINKSKAIYSPGASASVMLRYNANPRWAFVADVSTHGIKGNSDDFDYTLPDNSQKTFDNRVWMLSLRPEFHFWNYGWANDYREKKHLVPFLTAGIGGGFSKGDGDTGAVFGIPIGAGAKWKLSPKANLQLTCLFTRTFGDRADGIKDQYGLGSNAFANSDWIGSLTIGITFDFKERCFDCNKE